MRRTDADYERRIGARAGTKSEQQPTIAALRMRKRDFKLAYEARRKLPRVSAYDPAQVARGP